MLPTATPARVRTSDRAMSRQGSAAASARHRRCAAGAGRRARHAGAADASPDARALAGAAVGPRRCRGARWPDGRSWSRTGARHNRARRDAPRHRVSTRRGTRSHSSARACDLARRSDRRDDRRERRRAPGVRSPARSRGGDRSTRHRRRHWRRVLARQRQRGGPSRQRADHARLPGRPAAEGPDVRCRRQQRASRGVRLASSSTATAPCGSSRRRAAHRARSPCSMPPATKCCTTTRSCCPGSASCCLRVRPPRQVTERIEAVSIDGGPRSVVVERATTPVWSPTGHLLFARDGAVLAVAFDPRTATLRGAAVPVMPSGAVRDARLR